jgi:hypothetical protein
VLAARVEGLGTLPIGRIVDGIDKAVQRWQEPAYALRLETERRLPVLTGYSEAMVREGLPLLLAPFRREGLLTFLRSEFGDGVEPTAEQGPSDLRLPQTPRLITHVLSGNIPAVAAETMVRALLLRSASLIKTSSSDPLFPWLFAQSLAEADPALGASIAVLTWKGGDEAVEREALGVADAVIGYGGDASLEDLRGRVPLGVPFIAHGQRISFAAVACEVLAEDGLDALCHQTAHDVAFFDQQGCVSPHAVFVERGGAVPPEDFARGLARHLDAYERRWPRGRLTAQEAAAIQRVRATWEVRQAAGRPAWQLASQGSTAWTVLFQEGGALERACLNRTVVVHALDDLSTLADAIAPLGPYLQTAGIAAPPRRLRTLAPRLAEAGVTRICPIGQMQHPPAAWLHDGRHPLRELVRWTEVEG